MPAVFSFAWAAFAAGVEHDPGIAHTRAVGPSPGLAAMAGLNVGRTGRAPALLPTLLQAEWEHRVTGGVVGPPAVLEDGTSIVASPVGRLVAISASGAPAWDCELGSPCITSPAILSDGSIVVMTSAPEIVAVGTAGQIIWRVKLPGHPSSAAPLLPLPDGTLAAATGDTLFSVDRGRLRMRAELSAEVSELLLHAANVVAVLRSGEVYCWRTDGSIERRGSFGPGHVTGAALFDGRLIAAVGSGVLVELELRTGRITRRWPKSAWKVAVTPAVTSSGAVRTVSEHGTFLVERTASRPPDALTLQDEPGGRSPALAIESVGRWALIVDDRGTCAFALPGGPVGIVTASGVVRLAPTSDCAQPVGLAPGGGRRLLVACGSGSLVSLRHPPSLEGSRSGAKPR